MATYQFTKAANTERLAKEIRDSAIKVALDYVNVSGTAITCVFKDTLDSTDEALLNTIIATTENTPLPESGAPKDADGRPEFIAKSATGTSLSWPSHNFCDKSTWYQESIQVTGEQPVMYRAGYYGLAHRYVIDVYNGKIAFEDPRYQGYGFKLYDDGAELAYGINYKVNWDMGIVVLIGGYTPAGTITADYFYAGSSSFTVGPLGSKSLQVHKAEIQFSKDIHMLPLKFELIAGGETQVSDIYKNLDNLVDVGKEGKGEIPAVDTLKTGRIVFPVVYDPPIVLNPALGMHIKCSMIDDKVMDGERGTITFYTKELD